MSLWTGNRFETFKYQLLTLVNGVYQHLNWIEQDVISGSLNYDFSRDIIGTANFTLADSLDLNYLQSAIRPWYVLTYENTTYEYPLGTFFLVSPTRKVSNTIVRYVQGFDFLQALDQDKLETSYTASSGENAIDLIIDLLEGAGTWVKHQISVDTNAVLPRDMSYEVGRSRLYVINGLLNAINYYPLWCNGYGTYCAIPWSEAYVATWEFLDNEEGLYTKEFDIEVDYAEMYNKAIIVSQQAEADTEPLISTGTFEEYGLSAHPLSYTSIGRYITKVFESEAATQDYIDLRAKREIYKMLEVNESIPFKHAFVAPGSDGIPMQGTCYRFRNNFSQIDAVYKLESFEWYLNIGSLVNSKLRRVSNVSELI